MTTGASMQFDTKIAVVIRTELEAWQKLNVASFLTSGIAAAFPECIGEAYEDGSGTRYLSLIGQPILIYGAGLMCGGCGQAPATSSRLRAEYIQENSYKIQAQQTGQTKTRPLVLAGSPAVCKANYDQCMKGCDGAAQCSNQCMVNYNGCLR
jgi:hypothetical protein